MTQTLIKYVTIFLIAITVIISGSILLSSVSGCARVSYKEHTDSFKCNFTIMITKLKSIKGNESFEIGKYVEECFEDMERIECEKKVYNGKITNDRERLLDFFKCLNAVK